MSKYLIFIAALLLISGCSKHHQVKSDLQALSDRLESFTQLPVQRNEVSVVLNPPEKTTLAFDVQGVQIKLRDFYAIDDCPLSQFIAERNTALGKTQLPSTRFIYEHRLLSVLEDCMMQLQNEHPMYAQMQQWLTQKRTNLPLVWANMITQSQETYLALSTASDYISGESSDSLQSTKFALMYLIDVLQIETIDPATLELHLKALLDSRLPARMWRTQQLIHYELIPMSALLRTYIEQADCSSRQQKDDIKIMRNIFTLMFADKLQPLASQLNHYQYQLNPSFEQLANHPELPDTLKAYISSQYLDSAARYKATMQEHIQLWQQVFKLCE
ncbi:DUF3080 family protein [Glaciecola sp. XM2]|uniref:DUF3080 family protein n=1 Tax=Glaciecola sp. XM2 TaxID=1914931 RepID=UPI001BDF4F8A|nr:DUF3080 family protein [Glaciecola sp. XM2]MBT1449759.1 DUF3080 family protein [Glaciecola sp. XM2]